MRDIRKGYKKEKNLDALFVQNCMLSLPITTIKRQILDQVSKYKMITFAGNYLISYCDLDISINWTRESVHKEVTE